MPHCGRSHPHQPGFEHLIAAFLLLGVTPGRAAADLPAMLIMDNGASTPVPETYDGQIARIEINPDGTPGEVSIHVSQQDVIDTGVPVPPDEGSPVTVRYTKNGMALDAAGDLYFSESARDAIFVKRATGGPLEVLATKVDILLFTGDTDAKPEYLAIAPGNRLFFTEQASDALLETDTDTGALATVATENEFEAALSDELGEPVADVDLLGGLVHLDGALYVADGENAAVFAVDAGTGAITVLATSDDFAPFQASSGVDPPVELDGFLTADVNGDILIVDDYDDESDFQILRVDRLGGGVSQFLTQGQLEAVDAIDDDGIINLEGGIAFDFEGNFYVGQEDGDTVFKFPPDPEGTAGVDVLGDSGLVFVNLDDALERDAEIEGGLIFVDPDPTTGTLALSEAPSAYSIIPAAPNPFGTHTRIGFSLPETGHVRIDLYDVEGRWVARLTDRPYPAGAHQVGFDADRLAGGVYFYRIGLPGFQEIRKMTLVR